MEEWKEKIRSIHHGYQVPWHTAKGEFCCPFLYAVAKGVMGIIPNKKSGPTSPEAGMEISGLL